MKYFQKLYIWQQVNKSKNTADKHATFTLIMAAVDNICKKQQKNCISFQKE